eukprot:m.78646 g.78646  ORF g.78646 m.78646 type:complete len:54 (+) comp14592_c0_seq3:1934-2095(+)
MVGLFLPVPKLGTALQGLNKDTPKQFFCCKATSPRSHAKRGEDRAAGSHTRSG